MICARCASSAHEEAECPHLGSPGPLGDDEAIEEGEFARRGLPQRPEHREPVLDDPVSHD